MNNRRSEFELISTILDISKNGAKKTEILYKGNFSHTQLTQYLNFLIKIDVLEEKTKYDNGSNYRLYLTTPKGNDLLLDINKTLSYLEK